MADASADASAPQPERLTPPSTAAHLPPDTPAVFKGPPLTGQLAKSKYIETAAMPVYEMPDYIEHAKRVAADVRRNLWQDIEKWTCPDDRSISVKDALAAMPSTYSTSENVLYFPSVRLLNVISLAYFSLTHRKNSHVRPIVWHCNPSQIVLGDYLGVQQKPDTASGVGTPALLLQAARAQKLEDLARPNFPWTPTGSVGEAKTKLDALMAQLKAYVANDKRYRVDMATVHGFRLAKAGAESCESESSAPTSTGNPAGTPASDHAYDLVLASINACGFTRSPPIDACSIEGWLAHVVMVYDSYAKRHPSMTSVAAETTFTRWDVTLSDSRVLSLAPFYVTPPPGRVTFASFVVPPAVDGSSLGAQFHNADTLGFVKFSWQDEARTWRERDLLDRLHKKGWFPGVARHYPSQLSHYAPAIRQLGLDDETSRAFEMLHLGSIGEPLSQCKTPKQILMVAYDILQTSLNMLEFEDIIHRDLSWFNVFCKPEHDPKLGGTERKLDRRQFISSILGEGNGPCALIADLDHSAVLEELLKRTGATRKEKTGTPMFRSLELSCPSDLVDTHYNTNSINFSSLVRAFEAIEHEDYRDYLLAAFPDDDLTFAATFKNIAAREEERRARLDEGDETQRYMAPDLPHAPRHEAESVYWIIIWALGRALPRDEQDVLISNYNDFCQAMLKEGSCATGSGNRKRYTMQICINALLHPSLRYFEGNLLKHMATYFSIPWGLYEQEVGPHHAHTAMRRLILLTLVQGKPALRVELNTERPRRCNVFSAETTRQSVPAATLRKTGDASSGTIDTPQQVSASSGAAAKRPRTDDDGEDGEPDTSSPYDPTAKTASKHRAAAQRRPPAPTKASADPVDGTASKGKKPAFQDRYTEEHHLKGRSANSLLLKIWKDRLLWFGSGY